MKTCELCGVRGHDVATAMARFLPEYRTRENDAFYSITRCRDAAACRERTAAIGDAWPLDDDWRKALAP